MTRSSICGAPSHIVGSLNRQLTAREREDRKASAERRYLAAVARWEAEAWQQLQAQS